MNMEEINFAYKVRHALNQNLEHLPASTTSRLAAARQAALARKKADMPIRVLASVPATAQGTAGGFFANPFSWLSRLSVALPVVVVLASLVGMYQAEKQHRISELAEIDAMVLSDELPLNAYLDHGFNAFLARRGD
ncbi:DUF3619 family protein|uniref:DUF3619 family protein n=1 Tax=Noviherbaspirillum sp. L7-7A TaxID=2850560 RepID=UPI001C2C39E7|nr:DUF3619 family protein [Noviherbaspirillum sp. L7-7A]MBV0879488.1 DUF3619 family protein [Noviherbaspirillum sp. L7-7A]